jgi:subfamily B ATP-binding cassette protein HlyB/CyaB
VIAEARGTARGHTCCSGSTCRHIDKLQQENFLFDRSVRENIAIADPGLPMDGILRSAQLGAHEFNLGLSQGYGTVLKEHGSKFWGGQRQRIAIARALLQCATPNRVLVLEGGSLAEQGSHRDLLAGNGRYAQPYGLQVA